MPRLDGLGATAAIMAEAPARVLMVCAVSEDRQLDLPFRAMAVGALEVISKPDPAALELRGFGRQVAEAVRLMAEVPVVRRHASSNVPVPRESSTRVRGIGLIEATGIYLQFALPPLEGDGSAESPIEAQAVAGA